MRGTVLLLMVAIVVAFVALTAFPDELPDFNRTSTEMPYENNGLFGRVIEGTYDLMWNPALLFATASVLSVAGVSAVLYWREIDD